MLDLVGKKLGKYEITAKIGQGGMAIVYKAIDTTLQRTVALKVMLPHLSTDAGFVKRFQQEAITAANLKHPHIVTIYEVGEQDSIYYIAMEYVPGRTLQQIIKKEGVLSLERTVKLFNQIADALTYAHRQGLIHRDIKPSNILVDTEDNVTLTDFGIAKAAQYVTIVTGPGRLMGTPQYMSPEHAEGKELDHRSDIYALGVVLYEMLTGKVPFSGETPTPILYAHVYKKPPPPRHLNPKIPKSVERVTLKALAKRPAMRYQSAVEMAQDLREGVELAKRVREAALLPGVVEAILDFWELRRPVLFASIGVLLVLYSLRLKTCVF
jgi:serine/threonine-protein kinase